MSENQITRLFENHPIFILKEVDENDKTQFYFKAADVGKVLDIVNIRQSIHQFDEDERCSRIADTAFGSKETNFLTTSGIYRLLFNSRKPIAKQFRKWASEVLDDIIFNESQELKKRLEEQAEELKQKEIENQKQAEELKQKEIENQKLKDKGNWLYEKTIKKVNFKKRIHKNLAIYVASNIFEKENNIFKIGRSVCMKERRADLRTGSAPDNDFKMHKSYDVVVGLESATERYLHALMDSFHIDDKANTEHFMAHMEFIDMIVSDVIQNQFRHVNLMNDYIELLNSNNFDFDAAKTAMEKFVKKSKSSISKNNKFTYSMKQETKICQVCTEEIPLFKFDGEQCIDCVYAAKLEEIKSLKTCKECKEPKPKDAFFKDVNKEHDDCLLETCIECYHKGKEAVHRCCSVCINIKPLDDFGVNHKYEDHKSKRCRGCSQAIRAKKVKDLPKITCEICNEELLATTHLLNHQKTKSCIAASKKNIDPSELIKAHQESKKSTPIVVEKEPCPCFKCGKSHDKTLFFKLNDVDEFTKTCMTCFDDSLGQLYKQCNKCNITKCYEEFQNDKTQKSGKRFACKSCDSKRVVGKTTKCEICNKEISAGNMKRHQKTTACKAPKET